MITIDGGTGVITSNNRLQLPAGSGGSGNIIQIKTSVGGTTNSGKPSYSTNNINNGGGAVGSQLTLNRKSATSNFYILVSALIGRADTSGWGYLGYRYSYAGGSDTDIYDRIQDNSSSVRMLADYVNTKTGSVNDAFVAQAYYVNSVSQDDNVRQAQITIMEFEP